jgi:hypothetical protein
MSTPVDLVPCVTNAHNTKKEELEEEGVWGGVEVGVEKRRLKHLSGRSHAHLDQ